MEEIHMTKKTSKINFIRDNDAIYHSEWDGIDLNINEINSNSLNLMTRNPKDFAQELYSHIQSIDNELLSSIFTEELLQEITFGNLWILPNITLNEYKLLSQENSSKHLNQIILDEIIIPKLDEIQKNWNINNEKNDTFLNKIMINFNDKKYNICTLESLAFINNINTLDLYHENLENIQNRLEYKLNDKMEPYDRFMIKAYQSFITWIVKPLYYENALIKNENEKETTPNSKYLKNINIKEFKAIRMIMIIDSLINIFKIIGEDL